jgi:hypothetical protein
MEYLLAARLLSKFFKNISGEQLTHVVGQGVGYDFADSCYLDVFPPIGSGSMVVLTKSASEARG